MAENSKIEWTDATWNPITGCSVVSPGCTNCYAMRLAGSRMKSHPSRAGLTKETKAGPVWNGEVRLNLEWLTLPLRWKRPRRIFVCAHGDLFHECVPDEWIDLVFAVMALAPQHTFQILTKRPERMRKYLTPTTDLPILGRLPLERAHLAAASLEDSTHWDALKPYGNLYSLYCSVPWPLPNVWLGVSVEDQKRAVERVPDLLNAPARIRFISCEPLLGPLDLTAIDYEHERGFGEINPLTGVVYAGPAVRSGPCINWIICGGESGPGARPMHPDWARRLRDQCKTAGVPFLFKQWGDFVAELQSPEDIVLPGESREFFKDAPPLYRVGKKRAGRLLDGVTHDEFPQTKEPAL